MALRPYRYSGTGFSLQRDKNRFVLPAQFRSTLKDSSGDKPIVCLAKHNRWKCLTGFGLSRLDEFDEIIAREEERALRAGQEYDAERRALQLNNYHTVPFDGSGRFVLPEDLAALGKVEDQLYFQGGGEFFTLWAPAELEAMGEGWEDMQVPCRTLAAKELAKAKRK